jgi:hypothetical protein
MSLSGSGKEAKQQVIANSLLATGRQDVFVAKPTSRMAFVGESMHSFGLAMLT